MKMFLSPSNIYILVEKASKFLNSIFFAFLVVGLTFALILSPQDYLQGENVRIMYVHVPAAWISLGIFSTIALLSILNFIFKIKNFYIISFCLSPIGFLFTWLAIITGSIWGKPTWGSFWAWDARLTSMIFLMLLYFGLIAVFKFYKNNETTNKATLIISVLGIINLPIIKYSVEWWNTLHQPSSIKFFGSTTIHPSMLIPLFLMLFLLLIYSAIIFLMKYKTEVIRIKKRSLKK
tara:strand:+ start:33 stop:737 length:705 start_codon:yes stop_codon:yes gene_type:complete